MGAHTGPFGSFGNADGTRIAPGGVLVALYELRNADLISVDKPSARVSITAAGLDVLTGRSLTRAASSP